MKSVKGILVGMSLAFLLACESDGPVDPSLDGEGPVSARSPQTLETPAATATAISDTRIDLIWWDVDNETGYELYRSANGENGEFQLLASTTARVTSYSDTQANLPTIYCYKVRAVRATGSRTTYSAFSNIACALTPPTPPSNLTASVASYKIALAWQDNSNIEAGFQIFVAESEAGPFALRTTTAANVAAWLDDGVRAGATYCYRLRAFRTYTNVSQTTSYAYSPESNTSCATIPPPSQPPTAVFHVSATPFNSGGVVERAQLISAETQPWSVGYQIRLERSLNGGTLWSRVDTYNVSEYWDLQLTAEVKVCYRIIASNEAGDGQPSNSGCTIPPAAPTDLTMTSIDPQSVELTWRDNSAVEDGYQVWMTYGHGSCSCGASACNADWYEDSWIVAQLPANTTRYVAPPLYGDVCSPTTTSYYIVATKDGGTSSWSNAVSWDPATSP